MRRVVTGFAVAAVMLVGSLFAASSSMAASQPSGSCTSSFTGPVGYQELKKVVSSASGQTLTQDQFNSFDKNGDGGVCYKLSSNTNGNPTPNIVDDKA